MVVCVAQFVAVLDATIVTTALPAIRSALGFTPAALPWVITAYTLVLGGLLVPGGTFAGLIGPRRSFQIGLAVFAAASAGCALASSPAMLVTGRAMQGLGSALLSPAALALLTEVSAPGAARRRAVGWWTAAAATGGASGWVLGGLLTDFLGWPAVFWVNVPIGVVVLAAASRTLPPGQRHRDARLDLAGALAVTAALTLLVLALTGIGAGGLEQATSWGPMLLACGGLLAAFAWRIRHASDPLVPPRLIKSKAIDGANLTAMALTAATSPAMYLSTLYVQQILDLSPARSSLMFPEFNLAVIAGSAAAPRLIRAIGPRGSLVTGFAGVGAGTLVLAALPTDGKPIGQVLAAFALMGTSLGAASVASTYVGTETAAPKDEGVASGILNSSAQVGTSLGLAIITPIAVSAGAVSYRTGFVGAFAVTVGGLLASQLVPQHLIAARHRLRRYPHGATSAEARSAER